MLSAVAIVSALVAGWLGGMVTLSLILRARHRPRLWEWEGVPLPSPDDADWAIGNRIGDEAFGIFRNGPVAVSDSVIKPVEVSEASLGNAPYLFRYAKAVIKAVQQRSIGKHLEKQLAPTGPLNIDLNTTP